MSLKSLLMPAISQHLLSLKRLQRLRSRAERVRVRQGLPHELHYFHQVDDPYSALAAASLPRLLARYCLVLKAHVVGPPSAAAAPERERLISHSRVDAQRLARHWGLEFMDPGAQPPAAAQQLAAAQLVAAIDANRFAECAADLSAALWSRGSPAASLPVASANAVAQHVAASEQLRSRLGHYLGATFFYGGEWYWGIDRLYHLEQRLQELGVQRAGVSGHLFPLEPDLAQATPITPAAPIEFFFLCAARIQRLWPSACLRWVA
ncbi:MAG: hypothetical protein NTU86_14665 [Burkholderiales bacterium]|nr:hypothetical protein [Burkholderiales bacterium]